MDWTASQGKKEAFLEMMSELLNRSKASHSSLWLRCWGGGNDGLGTKGTAVEWSKNKERNRNGKGQRFDILLFTDSRKCLLVQLN